MNAQNYIVALKKDVDYDQFWQEIELQTNGLPYIPNRPVAITNNRDTFQRICQYALTDEEAAQLRNDPRVAGVELSVKQRPYISVKSNTVEIENFTKPTDTQTAASSGGDNVNWGLIRHSNPTNVYGTGTTTTLNYNYTLDGTGVDIVITDTGIQSDHPEFQYVGNTTSRVQQINWATYVPALSTMGNAYQDPSGHGTNVCGIAAGKTFGWAKGAQIYSLIAVGSQSADPIDMFDAIKQWHTSKGSNGRPTVVNMSWGYSISSDNFDPDPYVASDLLLANVNSMNYQGVTYPGHANVTKYGLLIDSANNDCVNSFSNGLPITDPPTDVALEELIGSGVIVCKSAGNNSYKIDIPTGPDYYNYATLTGSAADIIGNSYYYQQGATPQAPDVIAVGALDAAAYSATQDQKATFSCAGPGVAIWAAGTNIMSASTSNISAGNYASSNVYFLDNNFRQLNDTGTSQASPQITGMVSLYLQVHPPANNLSADNATQVKSWITSVATPTMYAPGNATTYTNFISTLGGNAIVAFQSTSVSNVDEIEVYVGGIQVQTGYTVINTNPVTVMFDVPPPAGVDVTLLVRRGVTWYAPGVGTASNGVPLQETNTPAARFLRGL